MSPSGPAEKPPIWVHSIALIVSLFSHFRRPDLPNIAYQIGAGLQRQFPEHPAGGSCFRTLGGAYVMEGLDLAHRLGKLASDRWRLRSSLASTGALFTAR